MPSGFGKKMDNEQVRFTGWNISSGNNAVIICILDTGCDLLHPDLQTNFSEQGINLGTMGGDGSPTGSHGTACVGIAAAVFSNRLGVAGVAGNCRIMPVAFQNWTDYEVAAGINYAATATNPARVISMSFGFNGWDPNIIDPEIQNAFNMNIVMCAATHNYNSGITYPATNRLIMACGASDQLDNRKSPISKLIYL
jgi:subtilisin family serine protease